MPDRITYQPHIMSKPPAMGRSLTFGIRSSAGVRRALQRLGRGFSLEWGIVGLGEPAVRGLKKKVAGLHPFPALQTPAGKIPSTQKALWILLRGTTPGALFDLTDSVKEMLKEGFRLDDALNTFTYDGGRDLTGYEDGTENPKEMAALQAALVGDRGPWVFSSFATVQRWSHDLDRFRSFSPTKQDATIGRRRTTNEEWTKAPPSAHVKRAAQESYDPPAVLVRRSMPWATAHDQGLEFISFASSLDPFEKILRRMTGREDGVTDALFTFSRPITGGHYWCPPAFQGKLDLRSVGIQV